MKNYIITIDLGTTNIKVGMYDNDMKEICIFSIGVEYTYKNGFVEFEPEQYWELCKKGINNVIKKSKINHKAVKSISLTGQAESLIIIDDNFKSLRNGISWMDNRSEKECELLKNTFDISRGYHITGQPDIIPTWPITKILWIKKNEKELFEKVHKFLLLKDYIIFKLTGNFRAEYTIYNFSYYFDIVNKRYWNDILDFVGIKTEQLPELIEPGEIAGNLVKNVAGEFNFSKDVSVNVGALDHFAGMIGTGNIKEGVISETTGTVLAVATLVNHPVINEYKIPCQYNAIRDTYVLMPVCESGGISLEWFKNNFFPDKSYEYLNKEIAKTMDTSHEIIFLPYITGTNSPEFDPGARGVFYGININHTKIDFARAVMEGVAYLLYKNIECLEKLNIKANSIISLGGGAKSDVWNQMKADITGKNILIPEYEEATSLGAAVLAGVKCGFYSSIHEAIEKNVGIKKTYTPAQRKYYKDGYKKFLQIYEQLIPVFNS